MPRGFILCRPFSTAPCPTSAGAARRRGQRIKINDREAAGASSREFYVASSVCEMGMLRVELEAIDE